MARWMLKNKHYLPVIGTEWEHKETDRDTGKQIRKVFPVPMFLDPDSPEDYTHRELNAIIVCHVGKGDRRDLAFEGDPTPDMEPLDDEAKAISDRVSKNWVQPMSDQALPGVGGYSAALQQDFMKEIAAIMAGGQPRSPISAGVDPEAFAKLQKQVEELAAANAALLAEKTAANEQPKRR